MSGLEGGREGGREGEGDRDGEGEFINFFAKKIPFHYVTSCTNAAVSATTATQHRPPRNSTPARSDEQLTEGHQTLRRQNGGCAPPPYFAEHSPHEAKEEATARVLGLIPERARRALAAPHIRRGSLLREAAILAR